MFDPSSALADGTLIQNVRLPARIRQAIEHAGLRTVGEVRRTPDAELLTFPDLGRESVSYLRKTLGTKTQL